MSVLNLNLAISGPVTVTVDQVKRQRWLEHCRRYPWLWPLYHYREWYGERYEEEKYRAMVVQLRTLRRLHSARERLRRVGR